MFPLLQFKSWQTNNWWAGKKYCRLRTWYDVCFHLWHEIICGKLALSGHTLLRTGYGNFALLRHYTLCFPPVDHVYDNYQLPVSRALSWCWYLLHHSPNLDSLPCMSSQGKNICDVISESSSIFITSRNMYYLKLCRKSLGALPAIALPFSSPFYMSQTAEPAGESKGWPAYMLEILALVRCISSQTKQTLLAPNLKTTEMRNL